MEKMARAFAEWDRRYREDPDKFMAEQERLADTCASYGEAAAQYFTALLAEV